MACYCSPDLGKSLQVLGYAQGEQLAETKIAVVTSLTDELRAYLRHGGRALWGAESSDSLQTHLGNLAIRARQGSLWQGDWATSLGWLCRDRLFKEPPSRD